MKWFLRVLLALYLFLFGGHYASVVKACHRCVHPNQHQLVKSTKPDQVDELKLPSLQFKASSSSKTKYDKLKATEEDEEDDEVSPGGKKSIAPAGNCFAAFLYPPLSFSYPFIKKPANQHILASFAAIHRFIVLRVIRI